MSGSIRIKVGLDDSCLCLNNSNIVVVVVEKVYLR